MVKLIDGLSRLAADLLFPPQCALCDAGGALLCDGCIAVLPAADGPRCMRCWTPVEGRPVCAHCSAAAPAFSSVRAAYVMESGARRIAHELKYEGLTSLAEPMARLIASAAGPHADRVVPVPLHRSRERSRGYNQSTEIARHLASMIARPLDASALRRVRNTEPLVKTMHRDERRAIVSGAFSARSERVEGRRILLIDDVVTTGATLDACARALLDAGAVDVRCLTWARAD